MEMIASGLDKAATYQKSPSFHIIASERVTGEAHRPSGKACLLLEGSRACSPRRSTAASVGILREYSTVINEHGNELVISVLLGSTIAPQLHEPSKFLRVRKFDFELVYLRTDNRWVRSDFVVLERPQERGSTLTFSGWFEGVT